MKKLEQFLKKIYYGWGSLMLVSAVYAQEKLPIELAPRGVFADLIKITIPEAIPVVLRVILIVAALVALVFLIIGGIKWITAGGDKAATESARGTITSAIIGLVVVFAAWAVIRLIEFFFNIKILTPELESIKKIEY